MLQKDLGRRKEDTHGDTIKILIMAVDTFVNITTLKITKPLKVNGKKSLRKYDVN